MKLIEQLEAFFEPITTQLESVINPVVAGMDDEAEAAQAAPTKGGKADPKKDDKKGKPPAKGGKGGAADALLAAYESNLPLTTAGIESVVLLLDTRLESLPFESL